jgi:hypothetical protein
LIAPNDRIVLLTGRNLLTFTSCVACACFWLVVVFDRSSGLLRQDAFFLGYFISFSSPPGTKRDTPPHALTTPPSNATPSQATLAAAAARSSRRKQVAQSSPAPPAAASHRRTQAPPFPPRRGASRVSVRRIDQRIPHLHCLPEQAAAARRAYQQLDREGPTAGHDRRGGGGQRAGLTMNDPRGGGDNTPGALWSPLRGGSQSQ